MNTFTKRLGFALIVALAAFSAAVPAQTQGYRQFVVGGTQADAQVPLSPNVIRQRGVTLDFGAVTQSVNSASSFMQIAFFDDAVYTVELLRSEPTHSGGMAYIGRVVDNPLSPVIIVDNGGVISVLLAVGEKRFSMQGTPGIGYVAREMADHGRADHPSGGLNVEAGPNGVPGAAQGDPIFTPPPTAARDDGSTLDVMVVYTQAARSANGGTAQMNTNVDAQIALTNTIYANSNVVQRLRLVYKGEVTYTEVNMDTDLSRITNADGFMDDVRALRDVYAADFVSLWGVYSDYCGLGWIMNTEQASFHSLAYNIVASPACSGSGNYTFAHELGHNMGLRHDNYVDTIAITNVTPEAGGALVGITYAHGYIDLTNRFRTVMSYNNQCSANGFNCTQIPRFSNPSVSFNNSASYGAAVLATTGNASNANERQALNDTRDTTANFRQGYASLTGPGTVAAIQTAYTVTEGAGSVQIPVTRHVGSIGAISVNYATSNGTATAGSDYTATSGTLNWANGDTAAKIITVNITRDALPEGIETFTVTLNSPTGGASVGSMGGTSQVSTVTLWNVTKRSDFDGNGSSDIVWHNSVTGMVYEMQMNGFTLGSSAVIDTRADTNWKVVAIADINGDGRADVVWQHNTTGVVQGVLMNGTTATTTGTIYTEPNTNWKIVGAGDFNGDGRADLLWRNSSTGDVFMLRLNGLTVTGGDVIYSEPNPAWVIQQVADFNGDGRADILWRNTATGAVYMMLMDGITVTGGAVFYTEPNANWQIQQAADFNGDGRADILWRNTATGDVYMMLMNGTSLAGGSVFYAEPNAAWKIVSAGDYNGDGRADILWRNSTSGQVFMMQMNGFTVSSSNFVYTEPDQNWKILP